MPPLRTLPGVGGKKHLQRGRGEQRRAHVAPVGDQSGRASEGQLQPVQGLTHGRQRRHLRRQRADMFEAQLVVDRPAAQQDALAVEAKVQARGDISPSKVMQSWAPRSPGVLGVPRLAK